MIVRSLGRTIVSAYKCFSLCAQQEAMQILNEQVDLNLVQSGTKVNIVAVVI